MDAAGVACATLVQPNGTYGLDNTYQCESANLYAPRTVSVGILDPAAGDAADKLTYWTNEHGMAGVRLQSQAEPDDSCCDAIWQRAEELRVPISIGGGGRPGKVDAMRNIGDATPMFSSLQTILRDGVGPMIDRKSTRLNSSHW